METSKKYLEGFNSGYTLRKVKPELAKSILNNLEGKSDYAQGLLDGNREYEKELDMEIFRGVNLHEKQKTPSKSIGKEPKKEDGPDYDNP